MTTPGQKTRLRVLFVAEALSHTLTRWLCCIRPTSCISKGVTGSLGVAAAVGHLHLTLLHAGTLTTPQDNALAVSAA